MTRSRPADVYGARQNRWYYVTGNFACSCFRRSWLANFDSGVLLDILIPLVSLFPCSFVYTLAGEGWTKASGDGASWWYCYRCFSFLFLLPALLLDVAVINAQLLHHSLEFSRRLLCGDLWLFESEHVMCWFSWLAFACEEVKGTGLGVQACRTIRGLR